MRRWRDAVAAGLGCMLAVAIATAVEPRVSAMVSTLLITALALIGLWISAVIGRRVQAAVVARRRFRAVQSVQPSRVDADERPQPSLAEVRWPA